jgi:DNA-binding response OmpR family regulator
MEKLLLIEDSKDCYDLVRKVFEDTFEVEWACTYSIALDYFKETEYGAIVLDLVLPDGDGINLLSEIKSSELNSETPVLILTSKTHISDKVYAFTMGAEDYICKPCEPVELKLRVLSRVKKRKFHRE